MNVQSVLNADMATIGRWLRAGFDWWLAEISGLLPAQLRHLSGGLRTFAYFEPGKGISIKGQRAPARGSFRSRQARTLPVVLAPGLCLVRTMRVPRMIERDIGRMVALDADRIMPMAAGKLLLATAVAGRSPDGAWLTIKVGGLPVTAAAAVISAARNHGVTPAKVGLVDDTHTRIELDFAPALREAGLLTRENTAAIAWWSIVASLFAANLALFVWRDVQSVHRLSDLVTEQSPAVMTTRAITRRIEQQRIVASTLAERRERQDSATVLGEVSAALPSGAWVQRFSWDGRAIRLTGYKREGVDVVDALRRSPYFVNVRAVNADVAAELPVGQPFEVSAEARARPK